MGAEENELNRLAKVVIDKAFEIHTEVGPSLMEKVYRDILWHEFTKAGLFVEKEKPIAIVYRGVCYPDPFRVDLLLERKLLIEVKCLPQLGKKEFKQLQTYLRLTGHKLGLLINFGHIS